MTDPKGSDAILARLTQLHPKKIDLTLGRTIRLLERLGNPQTKLPPVVHVAGTNGKGSLVAYLRAILEAAGYKVHAYTSPHLVRFAERIRVAGKIIDETHLTRLLGYCEIKNDGAPITFFEITTCAAFQAFVEVPADIVLIETGLGGRFDTTNVIDRPLLVAITPIGMDHMQFLGPDIPTIAYEKAAIQKPGAVTVVGPQPPAALKVIEDYAAKIGVKVVRHGHEWGAQAVADGIRVRRGSKIRQFPPPGLFGPHQIDNAGTAVTCTDFLDGFRITSAAIAKGLRTVEWPARLQRLKRGPMLQHLPADCELWLDGGHNADCGRALANVARGWRDRPLYLVYGMMKSKDAGGFLDPLAPYVASAQTVAIPDADASLTAEEATAVARKAHIRAAPAADFETAAKNLANLIQGKGPARVLICGSLYLAGAVLQRHG